MPPLSPPDVLSLKPSQAFPEAPANDTPLRPARPHPPVLRFTPYAWAKLQWFCHRGPTEIGGFGITAAPGPAPGPGPGGGDDLLLIEDFITVSQRVSMASVAFHDPAVADFFESQVDMGRKPHQFARLWLHTHPGDSPMPSLTDEETFQRVFGGCDWAVMFVLARGGKTYARLRFNLGPGGSIILPVEVDYTGPLYGADFHGSNFREWQKEYDAHIRPELPPTLMDEGCFQDEGWRVAWERELGTAQLAGVLPTEERMPPDDRVRFEEDPWNER